MASLAASLAEEGRREFRRLLLFSALAHAVALLALLAMPTGGPRTVMPGVVSVDLVTLPGAGGAPPAPPPPAAEPAPAEKPAPPAPKPPPRVAKKVVLPEEPRQPLEVEKAKPKPPEPSKPEVTPKPKPELTPKPTPRPPQVAKAAPAPPKREAAPEYEDLLAELRAERGEARPQQAGAAVRPGAVAGGAARGVAVSPAVAAWLRQARNHVRRAWVLAPGFRMELLETHVKVELDATGNVLGEPQVTRRSGNPWYDETVVRAIQKASPLPAPPEAGKWDFVFRPEE